MINDDIAGLRESVSTSLSVDRTEVLLHKTLTRPFGDAAIPPGQSVTLKFYAMGKFDILVRGKGRVGEDPSIGTDERRNGTLLSSVRHQPPRRAHGMIGSSIDGWVSASNFPEQVFRARLPFPRPEIGAGWELVPPPDVYPPPPDPVDPLVPFQVTIRNPQGETRTFDQPHASDLRDLPFQTAFPAPGAADAARGLWNVAVLNTNPTAMRIELKVRAVHSVLEHQQVDLPLSLINNLGAVALKKTAVTIAYHDGSLVVETPTHFLGLFGVDTEISLPTIVGELVEGVPTFSPVTAVIESQSAFLRRLNDRKDLLYEELEPNSDDRSPRDHGDRERERQGRIMEVMQTEIDRVQDMPADQAVFCLVIEGVFSDASVDLAFIGTGANVENKLPQIAFIFNSCLEVTEVVSTVSIDVSPLFVKGMAATAALTVISAAAASVLFGGVGAGIVGGLVLYGGFTFFNSIDGEAEAALREALLGMADPVSQYMKALVERVCDLGAVALSCELEPNASPDGSDVLRVFYYDPTSAPPPRPFDQPGLEDVADPGGVVARFRARSAVAMTLKAPGGRPARPPKPAAVSFRADTRNVTHRVKRSLTRQRPGPPPTDFIIEDADSLNTLDQHDAIVFLMMENRSFDHYFFELDDAFPGRGYERVPRNFTNPAPPGFGAPMRVHKNQDIGIGHTLIFQRPFHALDPWHDLDHTLFQIGGGTIPTEGTGQMLGFARDFSLKSDSPHVVLGYFGLDALPTYRTIADYYAVCTRWFASMPVGTQPNRLSALQGDVPFVFNLHMDDPSLGYLEDYSVFDLLDSQGISWKFFEGDIGTIRLYDRYRLNVSNVRPLSDLRETLRIARDCGRLPRVMVIEPEFLFGNDDHPPMDVRDGQDFVRDIIGQFVEFNQLDRVLFVLTYDEHGGFFDHVPPPGTPSGDKEGFGRVAGLFPQDPAAVPDCMGVRVPSMVLSRFISPQAKDTVLDHTSVLKTILLHNRHQISTGQFGRFGDRVKQGGHLGQLLDLNTARAINYAQLAQDMGYPADGSQFHRALRLVDGTSTGGDPTHSGRLLHNIATPRARRFVSGP